MCCKSLAFSLKLIPKINGDHVLNGAFEVIKFRPGKHREFSGAPTEDPTVVHVHLNKLHVRNLAPISKEIKRCRSQHTHIIIV